VTHGKHSETPQLLRGVEDDRGETAGHLGVEADLDPGLDLVLALDQQVQQLLGVDHRLPEVRHQADQCGVPFVNNLKHGGGDT